MKLKSLNENTWLIHDQSGTSLVTKKNSGSYFVVKDHQVSHLDTADSVNALFNADIVGSVTSDSNVQYDAQPFMVSGYPTCVDAPYPVDDDYNALPVFAKREGSTVAFCAGYYVVRSPKAWRQLFCPKLSTLETRPFVGPFKTPQAMKKAHQEIRANERSKRNRKAAPSRGE